MPVSDRGSDTWSSGQAEWSVTRKDRFVVKKLLLALALMGLIGSTVLVGCGPTSAPTIKDKDKDNKMGDNKMGDKDAKDVKDKDKKDKDVKDVKDKDKKDKDTP